ncbi:MAG: septum formation protein Maf [Deltaproteobacteria bacterium]|jgi:septum formation protein|nr:septum formation protein Maf [Deltaproteobacteria bacterium]MBT4266260.1 septum formation protein Maf [Deltaproteobacteria bacterium]MBT4639971.1 septum formation protein Maf [Deltaproteobacteria bacterium]MBT6503803.1 septum formation protein Maf [Deltaproteobacteria bacterium]MBT6616464.1 septum formation protein Maf [Deltaproteobacteria bacterium]
MLVSLKQEELVLASEASWRSDILNQLGIVHRCLAHKYNEPRYSGGSLIDFVKQTALEKARSIQSENQSAIIISADQLICLDSEVFYKSGTREKAIEQLQKLNGQTHQLICAVAVLFKQKNSVQYESASLKMRQLTETEIQNYVDQDQPWDCAGSYKNESLGSSLFEEVSVKDPTTIVGLPGNLLLNILREWGYSNLL